MVIHGLKQDYIEKIMTKSSKKENLFTNQKEIDRAIKAAVEQFKKYKRKKK